MAAACALSVGCGELLTVEMLPDVGLRRFPSQWEWRCEPCIGAGLTPHAPEEPDESAVNADEQ